MKPVYEIFINLFEINRVIFHGIYARYEIFLLKMEQTVLFLPL